MLVLSRKPGQRITMDLGDGRSIVITLVEMRGESVRMGFSAPADVKIWRNEIMPEPEPIDAEPLSIVNPEWVRDAQEAMRTKR